MKLIPFLSIIFTFYAVGLAEELTGRLSGSVHISCSHSSECGEIHSMKWYRDSERIYVYSPFVNFKNPEGFVVGRSDVVEGEGKSDLVIENLASSDEGNYRCEITYLDVSGSCPTIFQHTLVTTAPPNSVVLSVGSEDILQVSSPDLGTQNGVVGPYSYGTTVEFLCSALEGKPASEIVWKLGEEVVPASSQHTEDVGDLQNTRSNLALEITREHLGIVLSCSVMYQEEEVADLSVELDIHVPPSDVEVVETELVAGQEGTLECTVTGTKPQAYPRWVGFENIEIQEEVQEIEDDDSTWRISSTITFTPDSTHDLQSYSCIVEHPALEEAIEKTNQLDVKYAPEVELMLEEERNPVTEGEEVLMFCKYKANPVNHSQVIWYLNNEEILKSEFEMIELVDEKYQSVMRLEEANRTVMGQYSCRVNNPIGEGVSEILDLEILYSPEVELVILGEDSLVEGTEENITLSCRLTDGHPFIMDSVTWFRDSEQIFQEECNATTCDLVIEGDRTEAGNYTCTGTNSQGEGEISHPVSLYVFYTSSPGQVELEYGDPVKGGNVSLSCEIEDLGYPESQEFVWTRNGEIIERETERIYLIAELLVESDANYSCSGNNIAGLNFGDPYYLEVSANPEFLITLPDEVRVEESYQWINITCQVECYPSCSIQWMMNNRIVYKKDSGKEMVNMDNTAVFEDYEIMEARIEEIEKTVDSYPEEMFVEEVSEEDDSFIFFTESEDLPAIPILNQFPSTKSQFSMMFGNMTDEILEMYQFSNVSCSATSQDGLSYIEDTTILILEHVPKDIEIGETHLIVQEGDEIDPIDCSVVAVPKAKIVWSRDSEEITENSQLKFEEPVTRYDAGEYVCTASNQYGSIEESLRMDVMYVPECVVTKEEQEEDKTVLKCSPTGFPEDFQFIWKRGNLTFEGQMVDGVSQISLLNVIESELHEYGCYVNNTIGQSEPCYFSIGFFSEENSPMLIGLFVAGLILLIIIAVIAYRCMKKKTPTGSTEGKKEKKKNPADKRADSFYSNLPFHGLKNPPKQVLNRADDGLVYADVDAEDPVPQDPKKNSKGKFKNLGESKL